MRTGSSGSGSAQPSPLPTQPRLGFSLLMIAAVSLGRKEPDLTSSGCVCSTERAVLQPLRTVCSQEERLTHRSIELGSADHQKPPYFWEPGGGGQVTWSGTATLGWKQRLCVARRAQDLGLTQVEAMVVKDLDWRSLPSEGGNDGEYH